MSRRRMRRAGVVLGAFLLITSIATTSSGSPPGSEVEGLYFVLLERPGLVSLPERQRGPLAQGAARRAQEDVLAAARRLGGEIRFRYTRTINGFSAQLTASAAESLGGAPGVERVEPVGIVRRALSRSVPLVGAPRTWKRFEVRGRGVEVAVVDTGVDYTHAAFNGKGTRRAYKRNDPTRIERGNFPTGKVIAGRDLVGDDYDVLDDDPGNDVPAPDEDPLDGHGHGTHVASTCCGKRVAGSHGRGIAPQAKIHAYKVWGEGGSSTADVLVAAYELAVDPDEDGSLSDRVDVLNFSGGVFFGTASAVESIAAQSVVEAGVVFVAAAGNSGGNGYRIGTPASAPGVLSVAASSSAIDRVTGFSSTGPSRDDAALKPEITAPGDGIVAAEVGSGTGARSLSGTSMASPHVAGAAALMVQLRPRWSPEEVKAALMNQARRLVSARGIRPAPATFMGAGRMVVPQAARARSLLLPGALSFGVRHVNAAVTVEGTPLVVRNRDWRGHRYELSGKGSYTNVGEGAVDIDFSVDGRPFSDTARFRLRARRSTVVTPRLHLDPTAFDASHELLSYYRELPVADGIVIVKQFGGRKDTLKAPWLVVPYAVSSLSSGQDSLDLSGGSATLLLNDDGGAGTPAADVYILGVTDEADPGTLGEEDITHVGARSFTGPTVGDGQPEGMPPLDDPSGTSWIDQVTAAHTPQEPVEFLVRAARPHSTIETVSARVFVDIGADGVFADEAQQADFIIQKGMFAEEVCISDLSEATDPCRFAYGLDYSYFDTGLLGIVVDARRMGLSQDQTTFAYKVELCTDVFSGDVPQPVCDETAGVEGVTYPATFDIASPGVNLDRWFCGGLWSDVDCSQGLSVTGSAGAPDLLLAFPNNAPSQDVAVVTTTP